MKLSTLKDKCDRDGRSPRLYELFRVFSASEALYKENTDGAKHFFFAPATLESRFMRGIHYKMTLCRILAWWEVGYIPTVTFTFLRSSGDNESFFFYFELMVSVVTIRKQETEIYDKHSPILIFMIIIFKVQIALSWIIPTVSEKAFFIYIYIYI